MKFCVIGFGRWGKNLHRTLVNLAGEENVFVYDSDKKIQEILTIVFHLWKK